jgi:hypothetical protein
LGNERKLGKTDQFLIDFGPKTSQADTVILAVGIDQSQEREGLDRTITTLPGVQTQLIASILKLKKKVVLVRGLLGGGWEGGCSADSRLCLNPLFFFTL